MNKLETQAQFAPIISFGISCLFKESDTLHQTVQELAHAGELCTASWKVPPHSPIKPEGFIYSKFPQLKKNNWVFSCLLLLRTESQWSVCCLALLHLFPTYQCHRICHQYYQCLFFPFLWVF